MRNGDRFEENRIGATWVEFLQMSGNGFEFEWETLALAAGAKEYLRARSSPNKATIITYRELNTDRPRAFLRGFLSYDIGSVDGSLIVSNLRQPAPLVSEAVVELVTVTGPPSVRAFPPIAAFGGGSGVAAQGSDLIKAGIRIYPPGVEFLLERENGGSQAGYFQTIYQFLEVPVDFLIRMGKV